MEGAAVQASANLLVYGPLGILAVLSLTANVVLWKAYVKVSKDRVQQAERWAEKYHQLADNLRSLLGISRGGSR